MEESCRVLVYLYIYIFIIFSIFSCLWLIEKEPRWSFKLQLLKFLRASIFVNYQISGIVLNRSENPQSNHLPVLQSNNLMIWFFNGWLKRSHIEASNCNFFDVSSCLHFPSIVIISIKSLEMHQTDLKMFKPAANLTTWQSTNKLSEDFSLERNVSPL